MNKTDTLKLIQDLTKKLTESGLLVEAGFTGLRMLAIAPDAGPQQIDAMRTAFFCGAHHLFTTMMTSLDEGKTPTQKDFQRMHQIHTELEAFMEDFKKRHGKDGPTVQ